MVYMGNYGYVSYVTATILDQSTSWKTSLGFASVDGCAVVSLCRVTVVSSQFRFLPSGVG
jgi:hypothetical protein